MYKYLNLKTKKMKTTLITPNIRLHIISNGKKWCVKKEGASRALIVKTHREEAYYYARLMSNHVVVHNKDGSVCFITNSDEL